MLGAIAGDVIGSVYEHRPTKSRQLTLLPEGAGFTDDTVMLLGVAAAILDDRPYALSLREFGRRHPEAGYGASFMRWLFTDNAPSYRSWGNGAAMRVAPVAFAHDTEKGVLEEARRSAVISHDHPEGIKGAQATALAVFMARRGEHRTEIRRAIEQHFQYDLSRSLERIRPQYGFEVSCPGSVPEAILAFLESDSFEGAVRNAVSLGGDADTQACIAGAIAEAYYGGIPEGLEEAVRRCLSADLLDVVERWRARYPLRAH